MWKHFIPPSFRITKEQQSRIEDFIDIGDAFIQNLAKFSRLKKDFKKNLDLLLSEQREREKQKRAREKLERFREFDMQREKEELDKLRAKREQEEKERKEYEDKARVRQEEELKRKEEELKRKEDDIKRKEAKELLSRAVMIQHPCINLKIKIPKGVIPSLHSTLSSINSFVLVLSKFVFPPSFIISNSSKDFSKPNFDLELPFRFQLSQSENHNFCEMGRLSHFFKLSSRGDGPFKIIKKINDNAY